MGFQEWLQDAPPVQIVFIGALVVGGVALGADAFVEEEPDPEPVAVQEPAPAAEEAGPDWVDSMARAACQHHRNVIGDAVDGILTVDEIREKLQEVRADARLSDAAGLEEASTGMLAAATADDADAFLASVEDMNAACADAYR